MSVAVWVAVAVAVWVGSVPITQGLRINEKELAKYVARQGLPLPAHLREPLLRRITTHERWASSGAVTAIGLSAIAAVFLMGPNADAAAVIIVLSVPVGIGVGGVIAILVGRHQFNPTAPRVARTRATTLADYVPARTRRTARVVTAVAIVVALLAASTQLLMSGVLRGEGQGPWLLAQALVTAVLTLVFLVIAEVLGRVAVARPQHAESRLELAWDDVCRSESLRALHHTPIVLGVLASLATTVLRVASPAGLVAGPVGLITFVIMVVLSLGATALALWSAWPRGHAGRASHVRQRLWAGEEFITEARERTC
ncbi:hypothetical protein ACQBAU_14680 [Propionibacteriaceae bacterium Y2011]